MNLPPRTREARKVVRCLQLDVVDHNLMWPASRRGMRLPSAVGFTGVIVSAAVVPPCHVVHTIARRGHSVELKPVASTFEQLPDFLTPRAAFNPWLNGLDRWTS